MKLKSASTPIVIAASITLTVFVGLSGIVFSFISSDSVQEQMNKDGTQAQDAQTQDGFANNDQQEEKNVLVAPAPVPVPSSGGTDALTESNSETGIPIGTYSNPPAAIKSSADSYTSDTSTSEQNSPIGNFGSSSVESNRLTQQNGTLRTPDYSSNSSSNNYNSSNSSSLTDENSLVAPVESDTFLNSPSSSSSSEELGITDSESTGINSLQTSP
jgi:hypothetical protein